MKREFLILVGIALLACASRVSAQVPPPPQPAPQPFPQQIPANAYVQPTSHSNQRNGGEISVLYGTAAAYGVGMGVWFGAEAGIKDPGLFLIAPAILGAAAPVGVYLLDNPAMPRGLPAAIASGMVIGAGEGIGLASYQFVSRSSADAWGFRGLSRATAIGATLGWRGRLRTRLSARAFAQEQLAHDQRRGLGRRDWRDVRLRCVPLPGSATGAPTTAPRSAA